MPKQDPEDLWKKWGDAKTPIPGSVIPMGFTEQLITYDEQQRQQYYLDLLKKGLNMRGLEAIKDIPMYKFLAGVEKPIPSDVKGIPYPVALNGEKPIDLSEEETDKRYVNIKISLPTPITGKKGSLLIIDEASNIPEYMITRLLRRDEYPLTPEECINPRDIWYE